MNRHGPPPQRRLPGPGAPLPALLSLPPGADWKGQRLTGIPSSGVGGEAPVRGAERDPSHRPQGRRAELLGRCPERGWSARVASKPRPSSQKVTLLGAFRPRGFPRKKHRAQCLTEALSPFSPEATCRKRCLPSTDRVSWLPSCSSTGVSTSTPPCETWMAVRMLTNRTLADVGGKKELWLASLCVPVMEVLGLP